MKVHALKVIAVLVSSLVLSGAPLAAQESEEDRSVEYAEDDGHDSRSALSVGVGLVDLSGGNEVFVEAAFRTLVTGSREGGDLGGFLEVEASQWSSSGDSDFRLGLNIVGVDSVRRVDYFYGAGIAVHFIDSEAAIGAARFEESDEVLGINAHSGVDVWVASNVSIYGRFMIELLDDSDALDLLGEGVDSGDTDQVRVAVGARLRF